MLVTGQLLNRKRIEEYQSQVNCDLNNASLTKQQFNRC